MERVSGEDDLMELPPGFRFHPTDEELITHYLSEKVINSSFSAQAIGEVDLNKIEPWDLPSKAKMGEKEWYFFCCRDRKYPTGLRTNRATEAGYWKATGKDREIYKMKTLIGMKKTLVFYKGRAPRGDKTNWVMHEFRIEGLNLPKTAKNEWVICRIFEKNSSGKSLEFPGFVSMNTFSEESRTSILPPLMDCSVYGEETTTIPKVAGGDGSYVTCFSDQIEELESKKETTNTFNNSLLASSSSNPLQDSSFSPQFDPKTGFSQYPESYHMQDQSVMRFLLQNKGIEMRNYPKLDYSPGTGGGGSTDYSSVVSNHEMEQSCYEDHQDMISSGGPVDLGCLWNY